MNIPNETKERLNQIYGTKGIWDDGIEAVFSGSKYATVSFTDVPSRIKFIHLWNNRVVRSKHEKHATAFDILDIVDEYPKTVEHLMKRYNRYFEHRFINIADHKQALELVVWVDNSCQSNEAALSKPFVQIDELSMRSDPKLYRFAKQSCPDPRVRDPKPFVLVNDLAMGNEPKYYFGGLRTVAKAIEHACPDAWERIVKRNSSREALNNAVDIVRYTAELRKLVDGVTAKVSVSEALAKQIKNGEEKSMSFMYNYQNLYPKKIHFSGPCTIAIWPDGTKTIVRIKDGDMSINDPEKAIAMVCLKKFMGGHNFRKLFKEYMPEEEEAPEVCEESADDQNEPGEVNSDLGGSEDVQNINLEE